MITNEKIGGSFEINKNLQKITKGTTIIFIGSIIATILTFVIRILIARNFTQTDYGLFSLGFSILSIFVAIGCLGLKDGASIQISYFLSKNEIKKARSVTIFSLFFGLLASLILFSILFFYSDSLSIKIFDLPNLSYILKIFSISIPFFVLINLLIAIFRGFQSSKEMVIFVNFFQNLSFIVILCFVILNRLSFEWVIIANTLSIIFTCIIFIIYFINKKLFSTIVSKDVDAGAHIGKNLLIFSLPLLLTAILFEIMSWTGILLLGYFGTAEMVGLYDAASPLGRFISGIFLASILFIYIPVIADLYSRNKIYEIKKSYAVLTKWLSIAALPFTMIFLLFPKTILNFFFGSAYTQAGTAFQIITFGSFINTLMGLNGAVLTAIGKTKFIMYTSFIAVCINVILGVLLIPKYGINGAAIATVTALISINIIKSVKLYFIYKINPFEKNVLKPILLSSILIIIMYILLNANFSITFVMLPVITILFLFLYCISLLFTKSFDKEDIDMLLSIEKKMGLNLTRLKKLINKFI